MKLPEAEVQTELRLSQGAIARGDLQGAERRLDKLLQTNPDCHQALFGKAMISAQRGASVAALESLDRCLQLRPSEPDYVVAKAQILGRLGWFSQAIEWYRRAIKLRPGPELSAELAYSLLEEGLPKEGLAELRRMPPHLAPPELLAQAYTENREFEAAAMQWAAATRRGIPAIDLTHMRATSEIHAGRLEVAEELLLEEVKKSPKATALYQPLTRLRKITPSDHWLVDRMESLLSGGQLDAGTAMDLNYALGKAYHDLGEPGRAMRHFDEANRIGYGASPTCRTFDARAWGAYSDFQIRFFSESRIQALARNGLESETPLFIVGMIRSGTTLIEQILSCHSRVVAGGEKTFWPDHRLEILDTVGEGAFRKDSARDLGENYLSLLGDHPEARYVTEKNPSNVILAALIHCVFPKAKMIHVRRHPIDNLLSIWMTPLRTGLPFVHSRENLVSAYKAYARVARHLDQVMPSDRFRTFGYEQLTSEPEPTISSMLGFLDLESESSCLHPETNLRSVRTPSFYQVRQPINTMSQQRWRQYEPWLGPFAELLDAATQ